VADEQIQFLQDCCISVDRFLPRVLDLVLLNRISKRTLWPFAIDSDVTKFAQTMVQVSLGFLAVSGACALAQTPITSDTFVDMPDVAAVCSMSL
jgi:hypothetical protein